MNRGSTPRGPSSSGCSSSFNEAPIHESGKSLSCIPSIRGGQAFNEAPIHESGK